MHRAQAIAVMCLPACVQALGDYQLLPPPPAGCQSDADCDAAANEGCDAGRCAVRCIADGQCPMFSECWASRFCTEPIGTACSVADDNACGGYPCRDRSAAARPVSGYCPGFCNDARPCPQGFVCQQLSCYIQ